MLYTRPNIESLGWDLAKIWPNGISHHEAMTIDNRPVTFKYRNGWLQVWRGKPGEKVAEEQVLVARIGQPYHGHILAEQLCDLLGMTINGQKPVLTEESRIKAAEHDHILDWSGKTTYWASWHYMFYEQAELLLDEIQAVFPDHCLLQFDFKNGYKHRRYRQISFCMRSDSEILIAIHYDRKRLEKMLSAEHVSLQEIAELSKYAISIRRDEFGRLNEGINKNTPNVINLFTSAVQKEKVELDFDIQYPFQYTINTQFSTHDSEGQDFMHRLTSIIERNFFKGVQLVDLETKAVLKAMPEGDSRWFSNSLKEWCLEPPRTKNWRPRYLYVHYEDKLSRSLNGEHNLGEGDKTVFYGGVPL